MTRYAIIDAAQNYLPVAMARLVSPTSDCMFAGQKGLELEDVAPHLFECDAEGAVCKVVLVPGDESCFGVLLESPDDFLTTRKHLRRFLTVKRARDHERVFFRYYDPRVLRVFLPTCNPSELTQFFGNVSAFHCMNEDGDQVVTYSLDDGRLVAQSTPLEDWYNANLTPQRSAEKTDALPAPPPTPE